MRPQAEESGAGDFGRGNPQPQAPAIDVPSRTELRSTGGRRTGLASAGALAAAVPAAESRRSRFRGFLADHRIFLILLAVAALVRIVVALAYRPGLFYSDTLAYVQAAVHLVPDRVRPFGYSEFLRLLLPFHSFTLVAAVQHLMGLVIGAEVYAVLRRLRLPAWAAALAAVPVLFAAIELQLEAYLLSDTLFILLVTTAVVVVIWTARPRAWIWALAGLLLAAAVLDRTEGELLIIPFLLYLAVARPGGWRSVLSGIALIAVFAVPLAGYEHWFSQHHGARALTSSTGVFLYSRVGTFADCTVIRPPANERFLCPAQPADQHSENWYAWSPDSPLVGGPAGNFSNRTNKLATSFALRAIRAQPAAYLGTVWSAGVEAFLPYGDTNKSAANFSFPASAPALKPPYTMSRIYDSGRNPSTRTHEPFARLLLTYQRVATLPGPLLALIAAAGLAGGIAGWRRYGRRALLAWLAGMGLILTSAATVDYSARYVAAAVPVLCIAGALGARELCLLLRRRRPGAAAAADTPAA